MRAFAALFLTTMLVATTAHANDIAQCSQRADAQMTIDACTRVLHRATLDDRLMAMVLNNRANAYGALAAYDLALADYDQAIRLDPIYAHGYFNRGSTYLEAGRHDLAVADFTRALEIDPGLVQAFVNRGLARLSTGMLEPAIDDFTAALALEPRSAISHNNRGVAYKRKGQFDRAIADFEAALELDPDYHTAQSNRDAVLELSSRPRHMQPDGHNSASSDLTFENIRRNLLLVPDDK